MIGRSRFGRWLAKDDRVKEQFVAEIENNATDSVALERISVTVTTLREWLGDDPEFARAVRIARRGELGGSQFLDLADFAEPVPGAEKHPWMKPEPQAPAPTPDEHSSAIAALSPGQRDLLERELGRGDPSTFGGEWTIPRGGFR